MTASVAQSRAVPVSIGSSASPKLFRFFVIVVIVQGIHVVEHIVQLLQVTVFDVPSDRAFGLLGYVVNFNDTAEWLHLAFNASYLVSLYVLVVNFDRLIDTTVPRWVFLVFLCGAAGIETWHMTEHVVIISHVIRNGGCPCPGIGDQALGVTDIQLHFAYNVLAYTATVVPFVFVTRARRRLRRGDRPVEWRTPGTGSSGSPSPAERSSVADRTVQPPARTASRPLARRLGRSSG
jgi:hypothetical protein